MTQLDCGWHIVRNFILGPVPLRIDSASKGCVSLTCKREPSLMQILCQILIGSYSAVRTILISDKAIADAAYHDADVWGDQAPGPTTTTDLNRRIPDILPKTVEDALIVTKRLNYRYLWVDEICISQLNPVHRASQIARMDEIYSGADLTIVAAAGHDKNYGLPGVSDTPRVKHGTCHFEDCLVFGIGPDPLSSVRRDSTWWKRGWQNGQEL